MPKSNKTTGAALDNRLGDPPHGDKSALAHNGPAAGSEPVWIRHHLNLLTMRISGDIRTMWVEACTLVQLEREGFGAEGPIQGKGRLRYLHYSETYRGGPKRVADRIRMYIGDPTVAEALAEIREKFKTARSEGPFQVAYFLAPYDATLRERIQGEAYAVLRAFFERLGR